MLFACLYTTKQMKAIKKKQTNTKNSYRSRLKTANYLL